MKLVVFLSETKCSLHVDEINVMLHDGTRKVSSSLYLTVVIHHPVTCHLPAALACRHHWSIQLYCQIKSSDKERLCNQRCRKDLIESLSGPVVHERIWAGTWSYQTAVVLLMFISRHCDVLVSLDLKLFCEASFMVQQVFSTSQLWGLPERNHPLGSSPGILHSSALFLVLVVSWAATKRGNQKISTFQPPSLSVYGFLRLCLVLLRLIGPHQSDAK